MPTDRSAFDAESARASWDSAADAWEQGQASGRDYYRHEFFGPIQATMCGDVGGMRLLDVGCGSGYFAREMARRGARVTGIDIAPRMIEHAKRHEAASPLGVEFRVGDAAEIGTSFPVTSFDMATSCMALQDMADIPAVFRAVHDVLKAGGRFVASITHPCTDTPFREWQRDDTGRKRALCIDRYFDRVAVEYTWRGWGYDFTTPALHAPLEDWFEWIHDAGFRLRAFREPRPSEPALRERPDLEDATKVPYYVIFDLVHDARLTAPRE
jgi:ubiquinone/menaquinone biosynthesis C-methylase UbiE